MKKVIIFIFTCILLTGCSSADNSSKVFCSIEDWYMDSDVEIHYNENDESEYIYVSMSIDYSLFGEDYFEIGYEAALEVQENNNIYDGINYEVFTEDFIITIAFTIDLTIAIEEDLNNLGISLESFGLPSDDFISEQEEAGAICVRN